MTSIIRFQWSLAPRWGAVQIPMPERGKDEMNFRYAITYGKPSPKLDTSKPDEIKKAFNKLTKDAEKHGLKVVFWGSPWGVSEGFVIVYDFNKNIGLYEKFASSLEIESPITDNRTDLVFEW